MHKIIFYYFLLFFFINCQNSDLSFQSSAPDCKGSDKELCKRKKTLKDNFNNLSKKQNAKEKRSNSGDEIINQHLHNPLPFRFYSQRVAEQGKVDVLFVIDNSKSMKAEQQSIANQFDSFLTRMKNLDYRIAIITTDAYKDQGRFLSFNGGLPGFGQTILSSKGNFYTNVKKFKRTIQTGSDGSNDEKGIRALNQSLDIEGNIKNFFRTHSLLVIIIVSDEEPRVFSEYDNPSIFLERVQDLKRNISVMVNSIVCKSSTYPCWWSVNVNEKNPYIKMTKPSLEMKKKFPNLKTGYIGDIALPNYGNQLGPIAKKVISALPVTLPCRIKASLTKVRVDGQAIRSFKIFHNKIFVFPPGGLTAGSRIDIKYKCDKGFKGNLNI